jgi:citrate lyase subunit beta/citryl-CoA lyase
VNLRSFLFVPADDPKKFTKAVASGADAVIIDLEDSVSPERKVEARGLVCEYLNAHSLPRSPELWVRINPIDDGGLDDLVEFIRAAPDGIVVPKISHPSDLVRLSHMLDALERRDNLMSQTRLLAVATETASAPLNLSLFPDTPLPRLYGLTWGAEDLSTAIGATTNRSIDGQWAFTYKMVRSACLLAAKACGVAAVETLYADFRDVEGLAADCTEANREGFTARCAIHPCQVGPINTAFTPSQEDVARAQRIVEAFAAVPGKAVVGLDGMMLDIPHLKQAERVLARYAANSHGSANQTI